MYVGDVVHKTKHLKFILQKKGARTDKYGVYSVSHDSRLGTIKWHGAWFTYAFFPESDTIFNNDCLKTIVAFIDRVMAKRTR
jgi:hypothetical protein